MDTLRISIAPETVFTIAGVAVTNSVLTSFIATLIILVVFIVAARLAAVWPRSNFGYAIETIVEEVRQFIEGVAGDASVSAQIFPLVMTFFVYILVNNWIGLLPGISALTVGVNGNGVPLLRSGTSDLNTTIALAIISVVVTQAYAIYRLGIGKHVKKYVSANPMMMFVGILEGVSELTRLISFSFRLFGSVFAGEVLLVVMGYFLPLLGPLPFLALEVLFGLIQAIVFAMLTLVFMKLAVTESHGADALGGPEHTRPVTAGPEAVVEAGVHK